MGGEGQGCIKCINCILISLQFSQRNTPRDQRLRLFPELCCSFPEYQFCLRVASQQGKGLSLVKQDLTIAGFNDECTIKYPYCIFRPPQP